jgi:hypothetical protein
MIEQRGRRESGATMEFQPGDEQGETVDAVRFKLSAQQRQMVDTVRSLTQEKFKPRALKYLDGTFP